MSFTSPLETITPNGQLVIPQVQGAGQLSQLILDNLSTYVLVVNVGASTRYQAPLVEASYDVLDTSQPIVVQAFPQPGDTSTSGQLALTWYSVGEELPGVWPIALSGPAEVAAATAAALLAQGIPNVIRETVLINATPLPLGGTVTADVSAVASVEMNVTPGSGGIKFLVQLLDGAGDVLLNEYLSSPLLRMDTPGATLKLTNLVVAGTRPVVSLVGSNRELGRRFDTRDATSLVDVWTLANTAMAAGSDYFLTQAVPGAAAPRRQGNTFARFALAAGTAARGLFGIDDQFSNTMWVADTVECVTGAGGFIATKTIAVPSSFTAVHFHCTTAGTSNISLTMIDANSV